MKKLLCVVFILTLASVACATGGENQVTSPASTEIDGKDTARKAAERHLALRNVRWGEPKEVEEQEKHYLVHYPTPEQELRLIGERVLVVEKQSGVVFVKPRR